jgi:hypothetical protein
MPREFHDKRSSSRTKFHFLANQRKIASAPRTRFINWPSRSGGKSRRGARHEPCPTISRLTVSPRSPRKGASEMYEPNVPERNLICQLRACDNETLEIITPGCAGRMLTAAPCFQPPSSRAQGATPSSAPDFADADTASASGKRRAIAQRPRRCITSEVALSLSASTRRCRHTYVF